MHYLNIKFYKNMEVFRKIKYFMNVNVLRRTWTWIRRTIFCLRQRRKTDDDSDLRTVSERSWLRQLLSTFWDRDRKRALKTFYISSWRASYMVSVVNRPWYTTVFVTEHGSHGKLYSSAPGRCSCNLKLVVFQLIWGIDIVSISCEIAIRWMPQDFVDD